MNEPSSQQTILELGQFCVMFYFYCTYIESTIFQAKKVLIIAFKVQLIRN